MAGGIYKFFRRRICPLKQAREAEVFQLQQELSETRKLISYWSHDVGNLLNSIMGIAQLLPDTKDLRELQEYSRLLLIAGQDIEQIRNSLINIIEFNEAGSAQVIDLKTILSDITRLYAVMGQKKNITIRLVIGNDVPPSINSVKIKLVRVVSNLLVNAIKFSPSNESIIIRTEKRNNRIVIAIEDRGPGIPPEMQKSIFEPYTRLHHIVPGQGLGLAICKKMVEELNGRLTIHSIPDVGSRFIVELPI